MSKNFNSTPCVNVDNMSVASLVTKKAPPPRPQIPAQPKDQDGWLKIVYLKLRGGKGKVWTSQTEFVLAL